jgi:hypothetical protein
MYINSPFLFSLLNLLFVGGLTSTGGYFWRFKIWETYTTSQTSITSLIGTGDCVPQGCQAPISIPFKPRSTTALKDGSFAFTCPFFTQTKFYCKRGAKWTQEYGGCPYWSFQVYWVLGSKGPDNQFHLYVGKNGILCSTSLTHGITDGFRVNRQQFMLRVTPQNFWLTL